MAFSVSITPASLHMSRMITGKPTIPPSYWRSLEHLKSFTQVILHYARILNTSFWVHPGPPAAGDCGGGSARRDQSPMSPCGNNCLWNLTTIHALYTGSRSPRM